MNVLIHTQSLDITGGSKSIVNLANVFSELGFNVDILLDSPVINVPLPEQKSIRFFSFYGSKILRVNLEDENTPDRRIRKSKFEKIKSLKSYISARIDIVRKAKAWFDYFCFLVRRGKISTSLRNFILNGDYDVSICNNMYSNLELLKVFKISNDAKVILILRNSPKEVFEIRGVPSFSSFKSLFQGINFVGVSEDTSEEFKSLMYTDESAVRTLYNPFDFKEIKEKSLIETGITYPFITILGSLCKRKRVDRAIRAFSILKSDIVKLLIIGEGDSKQELQQLARELGVEDRIVFLGAVSNPYSYLREARLNLLTSNSEGLPRVLIESLICGTYTISTDCPTGPREILTSKYQNFLISLEQNEQNIVKCFADKIDEHIDIGDFSDNTLLYPYSSESVKESWKSYLC